MRGSAGRWFGLMLGLVVAAACQGPAVPPVVQAERFIVALNAGEVETLVELTTDPFLFREQSWRSAPDGSGFVLGASNDTVIAGTEARRAFLAGLVGRVRVRSATAADRPPTREALLREQLAGADSRWASLALFVFLRGEGDVEHTALTGVDEKSGKVSALYVN